MLAQIAIAAAGLAAVASAVPFDKRQDFDYQGTVVAHHNYHRCNHSASDIVWDDGLASSAQTVAQTCNWEHQMTVNGGGYGQNLAAGPSDTQIASSISDMWYNGEVNSFAGLYGQANPDMSNFGSWGHFTQVVWKGTSGVGCYSAFCDSITGLEGTGIQWFTVCNYGGPGNYLGEFDTNVGEPLGNPTVTGDQ